jgi:hypothetical protein
MGNVNACLARTPDVEISIPERLCTSLRVLDDDDMVMDGR